MYPENIKGAIAGMFWRFLVADDPSVDRYIVRDTDSRSVSHLLTQVTYLGYLVSFVGGLALSAE